MDVEANMHIRSLLSGIAIGVAAALVFDPARGGRRRALMRDKMIDLTRATREALDSARRDFRHRARGVEADAHDWIGERPLDDPRLLERVRARIDRVCSYPHAIEVQVEQGRVVLRGPVLAAEVHDLLSAAAAVRGVESVTNDLQPQDSSTGIPVLQAGDRLGWRLDLLHRPWPAATRALMSAAAVAAGGLALAYARR
jgi:hypothetical protein